MQLAGEEILTPFMTLGDDPIHFQKDWRHRVAMVIAGRPRSPSLPKEFKNDPWIKKDVAYLKELSKGNAKVPLKFTMYHVANGWEASRHGSQVKHYLQAMLLATGKLEWIAEQGEIPEELLKIYERLYFAIRNEDGTPKNAGLKTQIAAFEDRLELAEDAAPQERWKATAIRSQGKSVLSAQWGLMKEAADDRDPSALKEHNAKIALSMVEQRLIRGHISNEDMLAMINQDLDQKRYEKDVENRSENEGWDMCMQILQLARPAKPTVELTDADVREQNEAVKHRLIAEKNIKATEIVDNGPGTNTDVVADHLHKQESEAVVKKVTKKGDKKK